MNRRSLKSRHTLATVDHSTPAAKSEKTNDFMRVTATVKKKLSPPNGCLILPVTTDSFFCYNLVAS